ncbi:MAG: type IV pilus assembly protein PilM [Candidatus Omnitrophica bacterium]|nr:type IV pilus assembly protein PilM [Candidatus Omnitrophota bacterium]
MIDITKMLNIEKFKKIKNMQDVKKILTDIDLSALPFFKTKKLVGIDLSEAFLKMVEIDFTGEKPEITNFDIIALPFTFKDANKKVSHERVISFLKETFEKNNVEAKGLVQLITGGSVFSRKIRIPKLAAREVENAIKFEAANQIPFNLDSSYFDGQLLQEVTLPDGTKNDEFLIAASSKKNVDDMIELSSKLDMKPTCVGIPIFAMYNLARVCPQFDTSEKIAVIDLGSRRTNILIVEDKSILFAREIPIGDDNFSEAILGEFAGENWDLARVEQVKKEKAIYQFGLHDGETVDENNEIQMRITNVVRPLLERLLNEIRRSFDYFREQFKNTQVEKIILSGKGCLGGGVDTIFEKIFNVPIEYLNVFDIITIKDTLDREKLQGSILDLAIILGLVLGKEKQINFLPTEIKEKKEKLPQIVISTGAGIVVVFILCVVLLVVQIRISALRGEIRASNEQMTDIIPQIEAFNKKCEIYGSDKEYVDTLRERQILLSQALKEIANIIPQAIAFHTIDLGKDGWLSVRGYAFDDPNAEIASGGVLTDFIIAIENSPFFLQAKLVSSARGNTFEVPHSEFNISCKVISQKQIKEI